MSIQQTNLALEISFDWKSVTGNFWGNSTLWRHYPVNLMIDSASGHRKSAIAYSKSWFGIVIPSGFDDASKYSYKNSAIALREFDSFHSSSDYFRKNNKYNKVTTKQLSSLIVSILKSIKPYEWKKCFLNKLLFIKSI